MKKRLFSFLCVFAVILVFALTAQTATLSWRAFAEDPAETPSSSSTTKKSSEPEPYEDPTTASTSATTTTTTTKPPESSTSSTTAADSTTSKPPESSTGTTDPTASTTDKPPVSETASSPATSEHGTETDSTKDSSATSTTKGNKNKNNKNKTTRAYVPATTRYHISIPVVANTTVEGTTLDPMSAYFERISGDSDLYTTAFEEITQTTEPEEMEQKMQIPTIAIVAICLGGIALVTVGLTAAFAIRNKRSDGGEDIAPDYEQNAYGFTDEYTAPEREQPQTQRPQVDESDSFTVVSLDDKDYTD
jgi:hypothetical protein